MKYPNDFIGNIIHSNCLEAMKAIPDNAIDSIITDPPLVVAILFSITMKLQYWANNKDKTEKEKVSNYLVEAGKIVM